MNKLFAGIAGISVVFLGLIALAQFQIKSELKALKLSPNIENKVLGNTYNNPSLAETSMTESSTTTCSLVNNDGSDRVVTGVDIFFNSDDPAGTGNSTGTYSFFGGNGNLDVATGTTAFVTSSPNSGAFFATSSFSTSTAPQFFTTSTFTNVNARIWGNGLYLNVKTNKASSSTGFCAVKYYNK